MVWHTDYVEFPDCSSPTQLDRNTLLRDRLKAHIAAGHIHTPYMQNFARADLYNPSDATFAAWRSAIVAQGKKLICVVGDNAP